MLKRLTYISRLAQPLSLSQIQAIGEQSARNNQQLEVTGVLVYFQRLFFQIIEGEATILDKLYQKILTDPRHHEIVCLKTETQVTQRLFPNWSMEAFNLDEYDDLLIQPIKQLLQSLVESHNVIGSYTQPAVLHYIQQGINPLHLPPRRVERIILFGDIVSFSTLTEKLDIETVALLVNRYLEICSQTIEEHGGEVTKFIGDCVMAYFPIDQADNAVQACLTILLRLQKLRQISLADDPLHLLYCGFGLARGWVLEGNLGSSHKMDYTIIGDAVNTAARLEALTRRLHHAILFTESLKEVLQRPWPCLELGEFDLKGKNETVTVYSLNLPVVAAWPDPHQFMEAINQLHGVA